MTLTSKPSEFPAYFLEAWLEILNVSERNNGRNYPRAMQMAAAWGAALAEWQMGES